MKLDIISNLPSEVLVGEILSRLTTEEAVRTCVLSSQWRHKWAMLPDLVFGYSSSFRLNSYESHTVARIIDQILLTHIGPIRKFKLMKQPVTYSDVDRWILHLSRNSCSSIEEFAYQPDYISMGTKHEMPSCVYSFHGMIRLELWCCVLKPLPSTFRGFTSLKDLSLYVVQVAQDVLENMICCCPMLKRLSLAGFQEFSQFKINAPNLEYLSLSGVHGDISFLNTLKLVYVRHVSSSFSCLLNFFAPLHRIQNLTIDLTCFAGCGILPQKLRNPLPDLKFLEMRIHYHDLKVNLTALCLLRSSPALEKLVIKMGVLMRPADGAANPWLDDNHSCSFTELRHVDIYFINCLEGELHLIQLLLSSSPVLETMTVHPSLKVGPYTSLDFLNKLQRCKRASPNLEINLN